MLILLFLIYPFCFYQDRMLKFCSYSSESICLLDKRELFLVHLLNQESIPATHYVRGMKMKPQWPKKSEREQFEISRFISAYANLLNGRSFAVYSKQETPNYFLKDIKWNLANESAMSIIPIPNREATKSP